MTALELPGPLVSVDWLAERLDDPRLVVLDATTLLVDAPGGGKAWVSGLDRYLIDGHLPGAGFADLLESFSDPSGRHPFTLPDADRVRAAAAEVGIGAESSVVLYDTANGRFAARLWWLLRSFGLERAAVLDGGLAAWRGAALPVETGHVEPHQAATEFEPVALPGFWADRADVEAVLDGSAPAALVCSLPPAVFRGDSGIPGPSGHIPGSVNVPAAALVDPTSNRVVEPASLVAAHAAVPDEGPVILYCAAGIAASLGALALTVQGRTGVRVYDGSLNEWGDDPDAPLVTAA
ncbi:sulfurtransferase [Agromyces intestinalis]|uniref:Sulfurtransferase n=1 Tax=Agromyces intestinalis TaxID=2592652 RepID=A0A5C1YGS9_9MICO|nr:rhodanese-like domain-containing protein [Agromyces intestinalis]QEO15374.1 sulfurtransferase [Agromyces intestinalis]